MKEDGTEIMEITETSGEKRVSHTSLTLTSLIGLAARIDRPDHADHAADRAPQWDRRRRDSAKAEAQQAAARAAEASQWTFMRTALASATGGKLRLCKGVDELPSRLPSTAEPTALSAKALRSVRVRTVAAGRAAGMDKDRGDDLLSGVGEATMNAVVHGGGGQASVESDPAAGTVQVWVEDGGAGIALEQLPRGRRWSAATAGAPLRALVMTSG